MKNSIQRLCLVAILAAGFSCDKKESPVEDNNPCAKGKFLFPWCVGFNDDLAIIQVLDANIGGDFRTPEKFYPNTVLVTYDANNLKSSPSWNASDSTFYFRYKQYLSTPYACDLGNGPKNTFTITSFSPKPCRSNPNP
jgi:hypothetical protein